MLINQYLHTVDAKGRVFIPSKFRADLGSSFIITKSIGCIRAHTAESWKRYTEAFSVANADMNRLKRMIFSSAVELEMDSQGRVLIPEALRKHAVITDKVLVVGMGEWAEFWNPDKYDEDQDGMTVEEQINKLTSLNLG